MAALQCREQWTASDRDKQRPVLLCAATGGDVTSDDNQYSNLQMEARQASRPSIPGHVCGICHT